MPSSISCTYPSSQSPPSRPVDLARLVLVLGAFLTLANFASNLLFHPASDNSIYAAHALVLFLAAIAVHLGRTAPIPRIVRTRMRLWSAFLAVYACAYLRSALDPIFPLGDADNFQLLLYAAAYSLAFLAVVNPPSGRRWDLHGILDFAQAAIFAVLFFQSHLYLSHGYQNLVATAVLQLFLATAALLVSRAAKSSAEQRFTRSIALYFLLTTLGSLLANLATALDSKPLITLADAVFNFDAFAALALAFAVNRLPPKKLTRPPTATTVMPVLTTGAILLLCVPILRVRLTTGLLLLGAAFILFSVRLTVILSAREAERRKLLHDNQELRHLALTDPLTGIANRRAFMDALQDAIRTAASTGPAFHLVLMDLDNLKTMNDTLGHQAGDLAIQTFATALQATATVPFEHTARLGGDEFGAIVPFDLDPNLWLTQLKQNVASRQVRFSAGVATCTLTMHVTAETLIATADTRLYEQKQQRPR